MSSEKKRLYINIQALYSFPRQLREDNMFKEKLDEMGKKLDITRKDIDRMKGERRKKRFIYPFLLAIASGFTALAGCLKGNGGNGTMNESLNENNSGGGIYPYMIPTFIGLAGMGMVVTRKIDWKRYGILLITVVAVIVIGFFLLIKGTGMVEAMEDAVRNESMGNFSEAEDYGVYSKETYVYE